MLSAMFNLTGMVEDLLLSNGKTRKRPIPRFEEDLVHAVPLQAEERGQIPGTLLAEPVPVRQADGTEALPPARIPPPDLPTRFGSLGRRRGVLAVLAALLLGLLFLLFFQTVNGSETATTNRPASDDAERRQEPSDERPAGAGGDDANGTEAAGTANVASATGAAPPKPRPPPRQRAPAPRPPPQLPTGSYPTSPAGPWRRRPEPSPRPAIPWPPSRPGRAPRLTAP